MNPELRSLVDRIRQKPHYRDVDYDALAGQLGEDFLFKRLQEQLAVYERKVEPGRKWCHTRWTGSVIRRGVRCVLWSSGRLEAARRSARSPRVVERQEVFNDLPAAFDGYRILHLSDFHFDFLPDMPEYLPSYLEGLPFDLCVLTGDFRGELHGPYRESLDHLRRTRDLLGEKVYAVLGNHDNIEILPELPNLNIIPLVNQSDRLERDGDWILLAGIDDAHMYKTHSFAPLENEVKAAPVSVLLSHTPEVFREAAETGFDFMLSGHTHGGQICLPGGRPIVAHAPDTPKEMIRGGWSWQGMRGYTTTGIGASTLDVRVNCPPEIVVHTLRASTEDV